MLRQKVEELGAEVSRQREELRKKDERIDALERVEQQLRSQTGALDHQQLEQMRRQIAEEKRKLDEAREMEAERNELRSRVNQYQILEETYRRCQDAVRQDEEVRLRSQALETDNEGLNDQLRQLQQRGAQGPWNKLTTQPIDYPPPRGYAVPTSTPFRAHTLEEAHGPMGRRRLLGR